MDYKEKLYFAIQILRDYGLPDYEIAHILIMSMEQYTKFIKEFEDE